MSQENWNAVDSYFIDTLLRNDKSQNEALVSSASAGLPYIQVSPPQGKLLNLLVQISGSRRILEIGTLGGYSAIWMARALPEDGRLITLEANPFHAQVAQKNFQDAGLDSIIEIRVGNARESLPRIFNDNPSPFDFFFIDADKAGNPIYLEWALKLSRPGTIIVCDNVVRNGAVAKGNSSDPDVQGVRAYIELCSNNPRLSTTAIQTVGNKGYDGFSISLVQK